MRYLVGDPEKLERVRVAIDQHHGYRDHRGRPARAVHSVVFRGQVVAQIASDEFCARLGVEPSSLTDPVIRGAGGMGALELPEMPEIDACLGRAVRGVEMPTEAELVPEHTLPADIRDTLLSRRVRDALERGMDITQTGGR